ncbi:hypothetical protein [Demequina sp. NBRC 110053]|uniref:hypothetical protein n=1 Tax=Demequina sp. NBRC 110053 TaxID=1570342 RepID=UPI0009FD0EC4|nr:hypothetical protein [Demequina sp. NBRC 110053]
MSAEGFDYRVRSNGEVAIFHHGRLAKMMRGDEARQFLDAVKDADPQETMAAAVGNDGQMARPGAQATSATALHGNGEAHAVKDFRRKTG